MLTIPPMLGRDQIPCRIAACVAFIATLLVGILAPPPAIAQQTQYVTWTEREYVYTPGYIDEFVAEYDAAGHHWPVLQDANFNAVALAHEDGRVARQRVLSPYGRVIQEDSSYVTGSPATRIGHQGLFAERLDADTQQDPQAAGSFIAWHNRNRTLLSEYGRFAQRDPNGSAMGPVTLRARIEVRALGVRDANAATQFVDGLNIYQYLRSQPGTHTDPAGLFLGASMLGSSQMQGTLRGMLSGAISGGIQGGLLEGSISHASGGSFIDGFLSGALSGAIGGALTGGAIHGMAAFRGLDDVTQLSPAVFGGAGALGGGVGSGVSAGISGGDLEDIFWASLTGSTFGALGGGLIGSRGDSDIVTHDVSVLLTNIGNALGIGYNDLKHSLYGHYKPY